MVLLVLGPMTAGLLGLPALVGTAAAAPYLSTTVNPTNNLATGT